MSTVDRLMVLKARIRNRLNGTSGCELRAIRIGNAMSATAPRPRAVNATRSVHWLS